MKSKGNDLIATTAVALGTGQLLIHGLKVYNTGDVSSYSFPSLFIGLVASILWTTYQFKKDGMNQSVVYSGIGLVVQIYILQKLIVSRSSGHRKERPTAQKNKQ